MSLVNILNVQVLDNPSYFTSPFQFEITFECLAALEQDLEWKIIYVGSAESEKYDQILDCIMVGPVPVGINKFIFQAEAPNPSLMPKDEVRGVTVVLLICSYLDQEFIRVGYYVDNDFEDPELQENPPTNMLSPEVLSMLRRNILADKPRCTRFNIKWDSSKLGQEEDIEELKKIEVNDSDGDGWDEESDSFDDLDDNSAAESDEDDHSEEIEDADTSIEDESPLDDEGMMEYEPLSYASSIGSTQQVDVNMVNSN